MQNNRFMKAVLGAVVAIGLAIAVSYGLISQQTADKVQGTANQALSGQQTGGTMAPSQPAAQGQGGGMAGPQPQGAQPGTPAGDQPRSPSNPASPGVAPMAPAPQNGAPQH